MIEEIEEIKANIRRHGTDLPPNLIVEYMLTLSTLLGNMGNEIATSERIAFAFKGEMLVGDMSDAKAETFMKGNERWETYKKAKFQYETTVELIRSLKYLKRLREEELEHTNAL